MQPIFLFKIHVTGNDLCVKPPAKLVSTDQIGIIQQMALPFVGRSIHPVHRDIYIWFGACTAHHRQFPLSCAVNAGRGMPSSGSLSDERG
jgi:hypothetical protein